MKVKMTIGKPIMSGELNKPSFTGRIERSVRVSGNYNDLENKPSIEGVTLQGNKTIYDLGIADFVAEADDELKANLRQFAINTANTRQAKLYLRDPAQDTTYGFVDPEIDKVQASGISGVRLTFGEDTPTEVFLPDGSGLNTAIADVRNDIPTNVSDLENDAGYLTLETLPVYNGGVS